MKVAFPFLSVLLFAGVASGQEKAKSQVRMPFRDVHGRIVLDVLLDGKPATLLFDTGAEMSFRLDKPGSLTLSVHNGEVRFETGKPPDRSPVVLQLEFPVQGIVGTDALKSFHSVHIDYQNHFIELDK